MSTPSGFSRMSSVLFDFPISASMSSRTTDSPSRAVSSREYLQRSFNVSTRKLHTKYRAPIPSNNKNNTIVPEFADFVVQKSEPTLVETNKKWGVNKLVCALFMWCQSYSSLACRNAQRERHMPSSKLDNKNNTCRVTDRKVPRRS
jgi:hypothetical protein